MSETPTVLVVDDTVEIVAIIEKLLTGEGYTVLSASDGEAGLQKALSEMPDLVILDVMMPKMDGLEVCRRLKENEQTNMIPVVMLTSRDYIDDKVSGLESGADDYITKPFNTKEFVARINGIIDRQQYRRQRAEEDRLEALEKMLESVAHEVRNPIVAIGGFARRIRDRLTPGDRLRTYSQHIIQEVERLENMINEIISLKTLVVNPTEPVVVQDVLEASLNRFAGVLAEKGIAVQRAFCPEPVMMRGDAGNLEAAFSHILENAVEAMPGGGTIALEISKEPGWIVVAFSDTGGGIDRSDIAQVQRPFYTSKMSGAGMGLTMVKHIIASHGGAVAISSVVGQGTRVTVKLPTAVAGLAAVGC